MEKFPSSEGKEEALCFKNREKNSNENVTPNEKH